VRQKIPRERHPPSPAVFDRHAFKLREDLHEHPLQVRPILRTLRLSEGAAPAHEKPPLVIVPEIEEVAGV
jgi:hypothetical protein